MDGFPFFSFRARLLSAPITKEFLTKGRACPIAVAYLAYLARKSCKNGVMEKWSVGKRDIPRRFGDDHRLGKGPSRRFQGMSRRMTLVPEFDAAIARDAPVSSSTLPSQSATFPRPWCVFMVQPSLAPGFMVKMPAGTGTPLVVRLRSPARKNAGWVSSPSKPMK